MARRGLDARRLLTFGGQAPQSVGALIVAMVAATVAGTASASLARLLMLVVPPADAPGWLVLLEAWRLVTWPFFQGTLPASLITLLFAGFMLLWLGRQLSYAWSERRFLARFLVLAVGAGLATVLLLAPFAYPIGYFGVWPVVNALLVTWGLVFPLQRISWFGALDMTGRTVALAVTLATPAWALLVGPPGLGPLARLVVYLPHLLAIGLAWLLVAGGPRRAWRRASEWWLRRRLERRKSRFEVIDTGRGGKPPRWVN